MYLDASCKRDSYGCRGWCGPDNDDLPVVFPVTVAPHASCFETGGTSGQGRWFYRGIVVGRRNGTFLCDRGKTALCCRVRSIPTVSIPIVFT